MVSRREDIWTMVGRREDIWTVVSRREDVRAMVGRREDISAMVSRWEDIWAMVSRREDIWALVGRREDIWTMVIRREDIWAMVSRRKNIWPMVSRREDTKFRRNKMPKCSGFIGVSEMLLKLTRLHGVMSQKTTEWLLPIQKTSNHTWICLSSEYTKRRKNALWILLLNCCEFTTIFILNSSISSNHSKLNIN